MKKLFLSLSQLKLEIKKYYNINSAIEYRENRRNNWPSKPDKYYKDEWISWPDLFGKEKVELLSLSQLKLEVKKYKINSSTEYNKNRKNNWPSRPDVYYKDEWISWNDLFGKEKVELLSLSQLKLDVKKYNINTFTEYRKNRRNNWPSDPDRYYKDEWISWPDLFGREVELLSLSQLKLDVKKYKINSFREYNKNRRNNWPSNPSKYYKDEWISWSDLFGKEKVEFLSLSQLKLEVKKYNINSQKEYKKNRRNNWPSTPNEYYKDEWISWSDLFGRHFDLQKYIARKLSA